uniref:Peptidase A1 domain-containing protein n=1 Tax=Zea mays TaxID=4577 RepID=C0PD41_MAIZE|nr:unknown [Zea mays]
MALLRLLAISLLFAVATPVRDIAHDACSSEVKDFQHLNNSSGLHLTLHHPQSPCSPAPLPADLPFSAVLAHDGARVASLAARLAKTPSSRPPMTSRPSRPCRSARARPSAWATTSPAWASAFSILDTCFQGQAARLRVPEVTMAFAGGAALKLAARNLLVDVDSATTCLAFAPARSAAIIGNTQQQTFSVVYDVKNSKIGFAAGGCS